MKKMLFFILMLFVLVGLTACADADSNNDEASADGPPDNVTEWVFQPAFDSGDAGWDNGIVPWIDAVEEATEGLSLIHI